MDSIKKSKPSISKWEIQSIKRRPTLPTRVSGTLRSPRHLSLAMLKATDDGKRSFQIRDRG